MPVLAYRQVKGIFISKSRLLFWLIVSPVITYVYYHGYGWNGYLFFLLVFERVCFKSDDGIISYLESFFHSTLPDANSIDFEKSQSDVKIIYTDDDIAEVFNKLKEKSSMLSTDKNISLFKASTDLSLQLLQDDLDHMKKTINDIHQMLTEMKSLQK